MLDLSNFVLVVLRLFLVLFYIVISKDQIILGVLICARRFFPKFEALLLKSDNLFMIQSTVNR